MSMVKVSFTNPLTDEIIKDIDANSKVLLRVDNDKKFLEVYIIGLVELDDNNNPVMDSDITGSKVDM